MEALDRIPMALINRARIVKTDDRALGKRFGIFSYPRLIVSRDGKVTHFDSLKPDHIRNTDMLRDWMQANWHPLVPELTAQNARDIMNDKYVVLGILDRQSSDFEVAKKEIKNAATEWMDRQDQQFVLERQELRIAKQLRIEEAEDRKNARALQNAKLIEIDMKKIYRKEVAFAWIDGAFWERWIRTTFGITVKDDGDKVIINDHHVSPVPLARSTSGWLLSWLTQAEPSLLGHYLDRQPHRPLPHLHPRDPASDLRRAAPAPFEAHRK